MPNFETKEQVIKAYDNGLEQIAKINEINEKASDVIFNIFTTGIKYKDEDGVEQVSQGVGKEDTSSTRTKLLQTVFKKGSTIILEANRPGSASSLMMWFAKSRGITADEIIELGKAPDSEKSLATREKLENMKQDYADILNSADPEKISDFYMDCFKAFKKESNLMLQSGNLDSFVKNWPHLVQWSGATGTIQQSFSGNYDAETDAQRTLQNTVSDKLKAAYGDDFELRDMLCCMQSIHQAQMNFSKTARNVETFQDFKQENYANKMQGREAFVNTIRSFNIVQNLAKKKEMLGEPVKFFSRDMAKAINLIGIGPIETFKDFDDDADPEEEMEYNKSMDPDSKMMISEMMSLAGDQCVPPLYDLNFASDYNFVKGDESQLNTAAEGEGKLNFFDKAKYKDILTANEKIDAVVARKRKAGEALTHQETAVYLSPANPSYTKDMKKTLQAFYNMEADFRMNKLSPDMNFALNSLCSSQFGVSAEEYLSGMKPITLLCQKAYKQQVKDIKNGKTVSTVNASYHKGVTGFLAGQLKEVGSTVASSKEFVEMEKALKDLLSPDAKYPEGSEAEYKAKLAALKEKSEKYIAAKNADGKTERSTGRGQKRLTLAKRMAAFASESLAQMARAEEALIMTNVPENKHRISYDPKDFYKRMDEMLAPNAKGCQELIDRHLFTKQPNGQNYYVPDQIELAENCPFSDRDFAVISYAAISNPENMKDGVRYNPDLPGDINAMQTFTFSHDDIFLYLRANTVNDIPLFNKARHNAEDCVKEYMKGNKEPLGKLLLNNIDLCLKQVRAMTSVTDVTNGHVLAARDSLNLLARDPELMKKSGITAESIQEIVAREAQMKLNDEKNLAKKKLAENPDMPQQEKENCVAAIIMADVVNSAEVDAQMKAQTSPQAVSNNNDFARFVSESGRLKDILDKDAKGTEPLAPEEKERVESEFAQVEKNRLLTFAKLDLASSFRELSPLLSKFKDPSAFDVNRRALLSIVKSNPKFAECVANPESIENNLERFKGSANRNMDTLVNRIHLKNAEAKRAQNQPQLKAEPDQPVKKKETILNI